MAAKSFLLGMSVSLATALVPPCLPGLGPEFCPSLGPVQELSYTHDKSIAYPELKHQGILEGVFDRINKTRMEQLLGLVTNNLTCSNRFCRSEKCGTLAKMRVENMLTDFDTQDIPISLYTVDNNTKQKSIVLRIHGSGPDAGWSGDVIVLGAHFDSINIEWRSGSDIDKMVAPGADDNGTGVVVLMEVLQALLPLFAVKRPINQIQFHW